MEKIVEYLPVFLGVLVLFAIWSLVRKLAGSLSNKINNSQLYKEDVLHVLEEIRDELRELNKNNSVK